VPHKQFGNDLRDEGPVIITFNFEEITFSPAALPDAVKGERYSQQISASGSYLDFTYSISGGDIAHEFSISSDGKLTGTPTETGSHTIEIKAVNSRPEKKTQIYSFNVVEATDIKITPETIPDGKVGVAYGPVNLEASGGVGPYSWGWGHDIPPGFSLNAGSPTTLSGTPLCHCERGFRNRITGWQTDLRIADSRIRAPSRRLAGFAIWTTGSIEVEARRLHGARWRYLWTNL